MTEHPRQPERNPIEYDLCPRSQHLRKAGRHLKLAGLIEKAWDLGSIYSDLEDSLRCIREHDLLLDRDHVELETGVSTVAGALFSHAIILYARATESSSNHRRRRFGREWLRREDLDTHRQALFLRNDVIAHFGRGATLPEGPMSKEALVWSLIAQPERKMLLRIYVSRASTRFQFLRDLRPVVEHLLAHVRALARPAFDAVIDEIGTIAPTDKSLASQMKGFLFDEVGFYPSPSTRARLDAIWSPDHAGPESAHVTDALRPASFVQESTD